jgi:hypothetical protein
MQERVGHAGIRRPVVWLLVGAIFALTLAVAPRADAFVYYSNWGGISNGTVGRANTGGTAPNQNFIPALANRQPTGIEVNGSFIYWANQGSHSLSRTNLNGSGVDNSFLDTDGLPTGVAVNGANIFWTQIQAMPTVIHSIGKANLDGTGTPTQDLITDATGPNGLAVDSQHIYWADQAGGGQIGKADLDGGNEDLTFIQGLGPIVSPSGVAVDGQHIYWANFGNDTIGRADLPDGDNAIFNFVSGADDPCDVAVHGSHLYWANFGDAGLDDGSIGRADISGSVATDVQQNFITAAADPCGVAVDDLSVPSCQNASASTHLSQPVGVTLSCSSGGGTRTYAIASQPPHGSISGFNASTGKLTYIPDAGFRGTDSFTFRASNPGATSSAAKATITVTPNPNGFTIGKPKKNKHKGIAILPVTLPGAGTLQITPSKKVKGQIVDARSAGEFKIAVRANNKAKKKLKRKGKVKVPVDVLFSPSGGDQAKQDLKVKLKRKRRG